MKLWPLALILSLSACSKEEAQPTPGGGPYCCVSATGRTLRPSCMAGEVGNPEAACAMRAPDAGAGTCGNAVIDPGETCDPMAARVGCAAGVVCDPARCTCVDLCGDGTIQTGEECEHLSECVAMNPELRCRGCTCLGRMLATEIREDAPDVTMAAVPDLDARNAMDVDAARFWDYSDNTIRIELDTRSAWIGGIGPASACLVVLDPGEVARICYEMDVNDVDKLWLRRPNMPPEDLGAAIVAAQGTYDRLIHTRTLRLWVPYAVPLPTSKTASVYWSMVYKGQEVDRAPDTGSIKWSRVVGSE